MVVIVEIRRDWFCFEKRGEKQVLRLVSMNQMRNKLIALWFLVKNCYETFLWKTSRSVEYVPCNTSRNGQPPKGQIAKKLTQT